MTDIKLLGISGALRQESTNRKLLAEAVRAFGPCACTQADLRLPLFDEDIQNTTGIPPEVQTLADQIKGADAVVISTPEYNKALPGVLKNALDWVSRTKGAPFRDKPLAIMSAADGRAGGDRAQFSLRLALVMFRPRILQGPEVMIADSRNAFGPDGHLLSDRYFASLTSLMDELKAEIARG